MAQCAEEFYASSAFLRGFDIERFVASWTQFIEAGLGVIFILDDGERTRGAIGGIKFPDLYSGALTGMEMFWHVSKDVRGQGLHLYKSFENWARENGCVLLQMVHLADSMPEKLERFYKRQGMQLMEVRYQKELV